MKCNNLKLKTTQSNKFKNKSEGNVLSSALGWLFPPSSKNICILTLRYFWHKNVAHLAVICSNRFLKYPYIEVTSWKMCLFIISNKFQNNAAYDCTNAIRLTSGVLNVLSAMLLMTKCTLLKFPPTQDYTVWSSSQQFTKGRFVCGPKWHTDHIFCPLGVAKNCDACIDLGVSFPGIMG